MPRHRARVVAILFTVIHAFAFAFAPGIYVPATESALITMHSLKYSLLQKVSFAHSSLTRPRCATAFLHVPMDEDRRSTLSQTRAYHATERREILPLIGAATILLIARYSYRAMNRMEEEWEEYQWQLQQYERRQGQVDSSVHSIQTLAIDLGTVYSKIACAHVETKGKAEVVVSREGDRYFFNGVVLEDEEQAVLGRKALERFFFPEGEQVAPVQLPWAGLLASSPDTGNLVSKALSPVLQETMERLESKNEATRFVVTVPSLLAHADTFRTVFESISPESIFVPDPVAAVWGAQNKGLIPMDEPEKANKVLVVDAGKTWRVNMIVTPVPKNSSHTLYFYVQVVI